MKILAVENISRLLVERLRHEGHEVLYSMEIARGSNDPTVLELASQQGALLVTDDKDFGELVFHQQLSCLEAFVFGLFSYIGVFLIVTNIT